MNDVTEGSVLVSTDSVRREVEEALYLLEHVVSSGMKREDRTVDPAIVETVKLTVAKVRAGSRGADVSTSGGAPHTEESITASQWIQFELAYGRLAVFAAPVTAQTLRDTASEEAWWLFGRSVAQRFTWWLWSAALFFSAMVVLTQWGMRRFGPVVDGEIDIENTSLQLLEILTPYFYGGLGSCVYLLRSAHQHIYQRTFDVHRRPEYFNRILLGTVAGGAIMLFVDHVAGDSGQVVTLSSAALGFLAGYSTDFLFSSIERIIGAILPKVGIDTVQQRPVAKPPVVDAGDATLSYLLERYEKAQTEEDKKLYRSLVDRFRERI